MTRKVKTFKGKSIDFDELMSRNEETIAVGNMDVNARGDVVDARGNVVKTRDQVAKEYHKTTKTNVVKSSLLDDIEDEVPEFKDDPKFTNKKKSAPAPKAESKIDTSKLPSADEFEDDSEDAPKK